MISFPNAKINIGLHVLSKQQDGFHAIESLFVPVQLCDILEIVPNPQLKDKWVLHQTGLGISGENKDNLVVKAYELLDQQYSLPQVSIYLHKVIPMGAGLGGGSSNGAFALKGLNRLFNLELSQIQLEGYAAQLGSDCPFFIQNSPALVSGRGDVLASVALDQQETYCIVMINPGIHVSTKNAYSNIVPNSEKKGVVQKTISHSVPEWAKQLSNDFESYVFSLFPEVRKIKEVLYNEGALYASMTGSGSSVYGIFSKDINLKTQFPSCFYWSGHIKI